MSRHTKQISLQPSWLSPRTARRCLKAGHPQPPRTSYTDLPVRDKLAQVKLDMTVCAVGHS